MEVTVSVILPVFNGEKFLSKAIDSILSQTYTNWELIIIDDASTDRTAEIIKSYADARIRYHWNETNAGVAVSLNKAIGLCRGKYIARMDADDISLPDRLAVQLHFLNEQPAIAMTDSLIQYINEEEQKVENINQDHLSAPQIKKILARYNCINHPAVMIRREVLTGYRYRKIVYEDYDLWLRMIADGLMTGRVNEPLLLYRTHSSSITTRAIKSSRHFFNIAKTKRHFLSEQIFKKKRLSSFHLKVMWYMLRDYLTACFKWF